MSGTIVGVFQDFTGRPLSGYVELVPQVAHATVTGSRSIYVPATERVDLDSKGVVRLENVVCPSLDSNPQSWAWKVVPHLRDERADAYMPPFLIEVKDGVVTDLRDFAPVQNASGGWITRGEPGRPGDPGKPGAPGQDGRGIASVTTIDGHLMVTYTDGATADVGALPVGAGASTPEHPESGYITLGTDYDGNGTPITYALRYGPDLVNLPEGLTDGGEIMPTYEDALRFAVSAGYSKGALAYRVAAYASASMARATPYATTRQGEPGALILTGTETDAGGGEQQLEVYGPTLTVDTTSGTPDLLLAFPQEGPVRRLNQDTYEWENVDYPQAGKTYRIPLVEVTE